MLRYLASGQRSFGTQPLPNVKRINWEFYAVVQGRCGPLLASDSAPALHERTLWVFPPECGHGWTGEHGAPCRILAFHYGTVPPQLEQVARARGFLAVALEPAELRRLAALHAELEPHYKSPGTLSPLVAQRVLLELTLMVMQRLPSARVATLPTVAQDKVEAALTAYHERVAQAPSVEEIAHLVHVSPSHLRRLFWQVRSESPKSASKKVALERAMDLMSQTTQTLDEIAPACGFAGAGEFSRAFKKQFKVPPAIWRTGILPPYKGMVRRGDGFVHTQENHPLVRRLAPFVTAAAPSPASAPPAAPPPARPGRARRR
jgi:AraC family transcriptional regulator